MSIELTLEHGRNTLNLQTPVGAVAIGRNEGERLKACLRSLTSQVTRIVYVDSGSTDGSVEFAKSLNVDVVDLDLSKPFTMARARNAGFARLLSLHPELEFVKFVDGDCEVQPDWIDLALLALMDDPQLGSVCGHRTERFPEHSVYNRLTDLDWRGPVGRVDFCGGDVVVRVRAFRQAGGYLEHLIAGEDPEICVRLRQCGWKLSRLDVPMTLHDAAILHFGQWWKRTVRSGHAFAECERLYRKSPERLWRKEVRSNWIWGFVVPLVAILFAWPTRGMSLLLFVLYPVWMFRIARGRGRVFGETMSDAMIYGFFSMLAKFPTMLGQMFYYWRSFTRQTPELIEYKLPSPRPK